MRAAVIAQLAFIAVAAAAVYSFGATARDAEQRRVCTPLCALRPNYAARNRSAPDFELERLKGGKVRLSDYQGKVVIMNFWSKTCRPCLEEMPDLVELAKILESRGRDDVVLLGVCSDESKEDALSTLQAVLGGPAPFTNVIDPDGEMIAAKYGTKLYPETWFIDPQGIIRARVDGARDWSSPAAVGLAESLTDVQQCQIEFLGAQAKGPLSYICEDIGVGR